MKRFNDREGRLLIRNRQPLDRVVLGIAIDRIFNQKFPESSECFIGLYKALPELRQFCCHSSAHIEPLLQVGHHL
jgi:hypothetical protein